MTEKTLIISMACSALKRGELKEAEEILRDDYAFQAVPKAKRQYTPYESTTIFMRDGFIDRYSGKRLIFPPVLRLLSMKVPKAFPYHSNWKMDNCHIAYWELFPTVDHIVPVSRGGRDIEDNRITTSMLRNSAKANWLLEELGWELFPAGNLSKWDGMLSWFIKYFEDDDEVKEDRYLKTWYKAGVQTLAKKT